MPTPITVYIIGATGFTGTSIADALLESPDKYKVVTAIRPSSANKPAVASLQGRGADIHIVELASLDHDQLVAELRGAHVVLSTLVMVPAGFELQKALVRAAKDAGVSRFVPSDWATACVRGVMHGRETKFKIHDLIKELGLGYTFIDVGWWAEDIAALVNPAKAAYSEVSKSFAAIWGTGDVKSAITDRRDIGPYVARILTDDRTLNKYVFIWSEEVTINEAVAIAEKYLGEKLELPHVSSEELEERLKTTDGISVLHHRRLEYMHSIWIRGDNTIANAKRPEYGSALDAQELYPDYQPRKLESLVEEFAAAL